MKGRTIGSTVWVIGDGFIPEASHGPAPEMTSHETACILNVNDEPARVTLTIHRSDRERHHEGGGPHPVEVPPWRTVHVRFDELREPEPIPRGTDHACGLEASVLSRQVKNALMTTVALPRRDRTNERGRK